MAQADVLQISLSGEAAAQVRDALESGEYNSANEVVLDALRNWHREPEELDLEHLKTAWEEAARDDSPGLNPDVVFERVRGRLTARLSKRVEVCDESFPHLSKVTWTPSATTSLATIQLVP